MQVLLQSGTCVGCSTVYLVYWFTQGLSKLFYEENNDLCFNQELFFLNLLT
jgi:hypothetical protein